MMRGVDHLAHAEAKDEEDTDKRDQRGEKDHDATDLDVRDLIAEVTQPAVSVVCGSCRDHACACSASNISARCGSLVWINGRFSSWPK